MYDVSWLICSRGMRTSQKTELAPDPHTALFLMNSIQRWPLMRGSSGGISIGKQGADLMHELYYTNHCYDFGTFGNKRMSYL